MHVRARHRLATSLVALVVVLAAQLGGAAHEAAVRHVACAQHGEMIEAPDVDPSPAGETRFVRAGGGAGHEHCALSSALRQHGVSRSPVVIAELPAAIVAAVTFPVATQARTISIYQLAPKTSPPDPLLSST